VQNPDYVISTPENVELHLEMAGLGNRILACLIDTAITYACLAVVLGIALGLCWLLESMHLPWQQATMLNIYVISATVMLSFILLLGYFIYFEARWQGQTPGKRIMRIRVVDENGAPVSMSSVWIRNLVRNVDEGLFLIGLLFIMFDKKERRLGDFAGATLVIRERRMESLVVKATFPESKSLVHHIDAGRINPEEYQIVASFLARRNKLDKTARQILAGQLKDYLTAKVSDGQMNSDNPEVFLEAVYFAYQERAA
jgi:uncharacterized RDD family membrane protein YckC